MTPHARKRILAADPAGPPLIQDLESFYRAFFLPLVRRAVRRHGLSMEDAADVVQDAFILAVERLDASKNPKAWLYQVVDHMALNLIRKLHRRALLSARWNPREPRIQPSQDAE